MERLWLYRQPYRNGVDLRELWFNGLYSLNGKDKNALIWSLMAMIMAVISFVIVLIGKMASFGDIIITLLPMAHVFLIFKNTAV